MTYSQSRLKLGAQVCSCPCVPAFVCTRCSHTPRTHAPTVSPGMPVAARRQLNDLSVDVYARPKRAALTAASVEANVRKLQLRGADHGSESGSVTAGTVRGPVAGLGVAVWLCGCVAVGVAVWLWVWLCGYVAVAVAVAVAVVGYAWLCVCCLLLYAACSHSSRGGGALTAAEALWPMCWHRTAVRSTTVTHLCAHPATVGTVACQLAPFYSAAIRTVAHHATQA